MVTELDAVLEDLKTVNGTHVNKQRLVAPRALADGDEVAFGSLRFKIRFGVGFPSEESLAPAGGRHHLGAAALRLLRRPEVRRVRRGGRIELVVVDRREAHRQLQRLLAQDLVALAPPRSSPQQPSARPALPERPGSREDDLDLGVRDLAQQPPPLAAQRALELSVAAPRDGECQDETLRGDLLRDQPRRRRGRSSRSRSGSDASDP